MKLLHELKKLVDAEGVEAVAGAFEKVLETGVDKAVADLPKEYTLLGSPVAKIAKSYLQEGLQDLDKLIQKELGPHEEASS